MSQGHLILDDAGSVRVAGNDPDADVSAISVGEGVRIKVTAKDERSLPVRVRLRLHWPGARELSLEAPFPGQGGRFVREGMPVKHDLAVDDLYGVRAIALSPHGTQDFWVDGELKAPDTGRISRVAYFREKLRTTGVMHEFPVSEVRRTIELLLSASSSKDAHVALKIMDGFGTVHGVARVRQFSAALECNPELKIVSASPALESDSTPMFEAYPLLSPGVDPLVLETIGPAAASYGAIVRQGLVLTEPWFIVMREDDQIRAHPCRVNAGSVPRKDLAPADGNAPSLAEAMAIEGEELRVQGLEDAMDAMLDREGTKRNEAEWSFLNDAILGSEGLPASALDLLKVLVTKPRLLVRCLFRLESVSVRRLWQLEDELPFTWLLIRREIWWSEAQRTFEQLRERLTGIVGEPSQEAGKSVASVLSEGANRLPALETVATDVTLRLAGANLTKEFVARIQEERDSKTPELIGLMSNLDGWPIGYGREEWADELGAFPLGLCQHRDEHPARQPMFDTPVAAAWCCFEAKPNARTTFLVKRIRAHDRDWFDLAYRATWFRLAHRQDDLKE